MHVLTLKLEFHPPCPGLSVKKIEQTGAEPIDPAALVEDWVKTVDTVHSELAEESEKIFGNDGEFFHVQQDPASVPAFRDSGYYENLLDSPSKHSFDPKLLNNNNEKVFARSVTLSEQENDAVISNICKKQRAKVNAAGMLIVGKDNSVTGQQTEHKSVKVPGNDTKSRPNILLPTQTTPCADDKSENMMTPASVTSASDSEYQSGKESLGSTGSDSPDSPVRIKTENTGVDSPDDVPSSDMETSVDTGEVFETESPTDDMDKSKPGPDRSVDQAADNCVVS